MGRALSAQRTAQKVTPGRLSWGLLGAGLLVLAFARLAVPLERKDSRTYPATALAKLPVHLKRQPVLNDYGFGGPLILHGFAPFIDGRADMYGDDFLIEHGRILDNRAGAFDAAERRWKFAWTILTPDTPLAGALDRRPGWSRLYADRWSVVHVRDNLGGAPVARKQAGAP
jgi:hypothetical protein